MMNLMNKVLKFVRKIATALFSAMIGCGFIGVSALGIEYFVERLGWFWTLTFIVILFFKCFFENE